MKPKATVRTAAPALRNGPERLRLDLAVLRALGDLSGSGQPRNGLRAAIPHRVCSVDNKGRTTYEPAVVGPPARLRCVPSLPKRISASPPRSPDRPSSEKPSATAQAKATAVLKDTLPEEQGTTLGSEIEAEAERLVHRTAPPADVLGTEGDRVSDAELHDFYFYVYLGEPSMNIPGVGSASALLEDFLQHARKILIAAVFAGVRRSFLLYGDQVYRGPVGGDIAISSDELTQGRASEEDLLLLADVLFDLFLKYSASSLFTLYAALSETFRIALLGVFDVWLQGLFQRTDWECVSPLEHSAADVDTWQAADSQITTIFWSTYPSATTDPYREDPYTFPSFASGEVTFGLQLVYRQEWIRIGNQKGPIIKTIPLGPKQTEKVSVKVVQTAKLSRQVDTSREQETTTESATTQKDSSEIVREAADSLNFKLDTSTKASASGTIGVFQASGEASMSAGVASESSSKSSDTKSVLTEAVAKTASRIRNETKIVVSTEQTRTEELATASEITNPNDEIAITYVYARLQRRYQVHTFLAEVNAVAFVPEPLPVEIDGRWVREHDWILSKVLLDESFREDLASVVNEPEPPPLSPEEQTAREADMKIFRDLASNAGAGIANLKEYASLKVPDVLSGAGDTLARRLDRRDAQTEAIARRTQRQYRLFRHIRENILHYMRAIWSQEDPEQRMQRYRLLPVPTEWVFVPDSTSASQGMTAAWPGTFVPVQSSTRPLSRLINPAGPIGFAANCAVFYVSGAPATINLNRALSYLRSQYVRYDLQVSGGTTPRVRDAFVLQPHWLSARYDITWAAGAVSISNRTPEVTYQLPSEAITIEEGGSVLQFEGVVLAFDSPPGDAVLTVEIWMTGELQDPEIPVLRRTYLLPPAGVEDRLFGRLLEEMSTETEELEDLEGRSWSDLDTEAKDRVRATYHRYLMRKQYTRQLVLDTNSVTLDLEVGETGALESFKRLDRAVGIAKALEEYRHLKQENRRLTERVTAGDLSDPEIDKVVVVGPRDALTSLVGSVAGDDDD